MNVSSVLLSLLCLVPAMPAVCQNHISENKQEVINSVDRHKQELTDLSDQIWAYAETALNEYQSSETLADFAEEHGFIVEKGVAGMPTAFVASYGSGKPVIGILGEYDALPGLSQKVQVTREELVKGGTGHGCGHNLLGAGSMGAALAIKELIAENKLKGTIRLYGTPAEEDVGGKIYMARAGLFDDLDVCLDWHPYYENKANMQSSLAMMDYSISFKGKSAHSAADPWNGRSALDAAEIFTTGINFLREHVKPSVRMHYTYSSGGNVPNVIPEEASVWLWIRDAQRDGVAGVSERVKDIAKGAALIAGVAYDIELNSGVYEILINETGAKALHHNMALLGPLTYTEEERAFADRIMKGYGMEAKGINGSIKPLELTKEDPGTGSSDVGDVSYIVPVISLRATTAPDESPWHSWVVVACGGMSIGHKGMLFASKTLGATMVDLFENEELRNEIRAEFLDRKGRRVYKAMVPDGPPPIPGSSMN